MQRLRSATHIKFQIVYVLLESFCTFSRFEVLRLWTSRARNRHNELWIDSIKERLARVPLTQSLPLPSVPSHLLRPSKTDTMASALSTKMMIGAVRVPARSTAGQAARPIKQLVVRASTEPASTSTEASASTSGSIFYGGKTYTDEEWKKALLDGTAQMNRDDMPGNAVSGGGSTIADVMAFSGPAPEIINGRLAMLGFVAAAAAEVRTDETVLKQWAQEPTLISLTFLLFMAGSIVPLVSGKKDSLGPFTPEAEMLNGRAAMIGFAAMIAFEGVKGAALF